MRCFIAVDLDPSLAGKIKELQSQIKNPDLKLIEENNLHFTLKFLGDISEKTLESTKKGLSELASLIPAFEINIQGLGVFPSEKFMRVVWVGSGSKEFLELHEAVNDALSKLFDKEKSSPHLTIARIKSGRSNQDVIQAVKKHKNIEIGSMMVEKIKLKKSTLTKEGPIYEDIAEFFLG